MAVRDRETLRQDLARLIGPEHHVRQASLRDVLLRASPLPAAADQQEHDVGSAPTAVGRQPSGRRTRERGRNCRSSRRRTCRRAATRGEGVQFGSRGMGAIRSPEDQFGITWTRSFAMPFFSTVSAISSPSTTFAAPPRETIAEPRQWTVEKHPEPAEVEPPRDFREEIVKPVDERRAFQPGHDRHRQRQQGGRHRSSRRPHRRARAGASAEGSADT